MLITLWTAGHVGLIDTLPPVAILTPSALLGLAIFLILSGRLVPRQTLRDVEHDRDEWRAAHRISETARLEEREHNGTLTRDIAEPLRGFLEGFRKAAGRTEEDR